jgi:hypothetical protein
MDLGAMLKRIVSSDLYCHALLPRRLLQSSAGQRGDHHWRPKVSIAACALLPSCSVDPLCADQVGVMQCGAMAHYDLLMAKPLMSHFPINST